MKHCKPVISVVFSLVTLPVLVVAEDFEQHAAHEHGKAQLNLVSENNQVMIELSSPAVNIVGFEHRARNDEQRSVVQKAHDQLEMASDLFVFSPEAECKVSKVDLDGEIFRNEDGDNHAEHEHEHEHEDDHHDHHSEKHAEHEDHHQEKHAEHEDHHDGHHHEASHSDIVASYNFNCKHPNDLNYVDILLFKVFSGFEEIDAQVISNKGQNAIELTGSNYRISW